MHITQYDCQAFDSSNFDQSCCLFPCEKRCLPALDALEVVLIHVISKGCTLCEMCFICVGIRFILGDVQHCEMLVGSYLPAFTFLR